MLSFPASLRAFACTQPTDMRYELSEDERGRPCCGERREAIGEERGEQLEYAPAVLKIVEHVPADRRGGVLGTLSAVLVAIDNNAAERAVKIVAIGRKNWLFVASDTGGTRAAKLFSPIAGCKQNAVDPWPYLRDVFAAWPLLGATPSPVELDRLLPDRWLQAHPEHAWRIHEVRNSKPQA